MTAIAVKQIDEPACQDDTGCDVECRNDERWVNYPVTLDNWREALIEQAERGEDGKRLSFAEIARRIGYARPSLSLALHGKYVGDIKTIAQAYVDYRTSVVCIYTQANVGRDYCQEHANAEPPTHNPQSLRHWRVCQNCKHKPFINK